MSKGDYFLHLIINIAFGVAGAGALSVALKWPLARAGFLVAGVFFIIEALTPWREK